MKLPIPNDWNGQDWLCIQIEWPDSPQWIGIFSGLITSIMRGRLWDENTGLITGAQSTGEEIYAKNFPFNLCDSNADSGGSVGDAGSIDFAMAACDAIERGINSMTLCGYNPKAFKIEDGTLYVKDFCGEWVAIGELDTTLPEPPTDGYDFDDTESGLSPCGKATALADKLIDVAAYFWDNSDNSFFPVIEIQAQNSTGVELKSKYAAELWALTLAHKGLRTGTVGVVPLDRDNVLPEDLLEKMACLMVSGLSADLFESDGELINGLAESAIGKIFPPVDVDNIAAQAWWYVVLAMVGKAKMVQLANAGAYDTVADCSGCDLIIEPPPAITGNVFWQNSYDVVLESQGALLEVRTITTPYIQELTYVSGQNANFAEVHGRLYLAHPSGTIGELEVTIENRQQSTTGDYFLAKDWIDTTPTPQANYTLPVVEGVATPDTINYIKSANKIVCVYQWDTPINVDVAKLFLSTKINPKDNTAVRQRYYVDATITYSGNQR